MKKYNLFATIATCLTLPGALHAAVCQESSKADIQRLFGETDACESIESDEDAISYCTSKGTPRYYLSASKDKCYIVWDCNTCANPFEREPQYLDDCSNVSYYSCVCKCGTSCKDDSNWSAGATGYEKFVRRDCSCDSGTKQCNETSEYRCAKNYYGSSTNGTSGCTRCPSSTDYVAYEAAKGWVSTGNKSPGYTTAAGNTTAVNKCFIYGLGGSNMYLDSNGAYEFTSNCYWS